MQEKYVVRWPHTSSFCIEACLIWITLPTILSSTFQHQFPGDYLKQFINRVKGGRFYAFSMPDGIVYVQVAFFWQAAKRLSRNHPRLLAADADIQARRDIMFSMVERLKERKAIATDLLGPGFFMACFIINPASEEPREENLIPFRAEAFGEPVSILEARKVHRLRDIQQVMAKHLLEKKESIFG